MLISEAIEAFERHITYVDTRSTNTVSAYIRDIRAFASYISEKQSVEDITKEDVDNYFSNELETYANPSKNRIRTSLTNFFAYMENHYGTPNHAAKVAKFKEDQKLPRVMSENQINTLLDGTPDTPREILDAAIFELIYGSGLRASEVCTVKLNDLSLAEREIKIRGKGDKDRVIPLSDMSIKRLLEYLPIRDGWNTQKSSLLFVNQKGNKLNREFIHAHLKKLLREKKLPSEFSTHTLRHSFATHLMGEGVNIRTVQELLGHEDISTTQIYTHVDTTTLRKEYDLYFPRK